MACTNGAGVGCRRARDIARRAARLVSTGPAVAAVTSSRWTALLAAREASTDSAPCGNWPALILSSNQSAA